MFGTVIEKAKDAWAYLIAFLGFMIFLAWINNPEIVLPIISDESANLAANNYAKMILLWSSGLTVLVAYLSTLLPSFRQKDIPEQSKKPFKIDEIYLLKRSDNLDRVTNYLRSGISLLAAVFTAIIAWILDMSSNREITSIEMTLITISSILVFFSVISVMISFGSTTVKARGYVLEEDLLPSGQSLWLFLKQLKECVKIKSRIISRMKSTIGTGLTLFIIIGGLMLIGPIYDAVESYWSIYCVVAMIGSISQLTFIILIVLFGIAVVVMLGIDTYMDITEDIEELIQKTKKDMAS